MTAAVELSVWDKLKAPFPLDEIEKLPKQVVKDDRDRGKCQQTTPRYSADGTFCGGYHARSVHLDYVGHAGITMRLNAAAGPDGWSWEPAYRDIPTDLVAKAIDAGMTDLAQSLIDNAPAKYTDGGLWIKLTIHGVTKLGFGDAGGKTGPNAVKELIGDCLRNASMRFGVATYLWSKSEASAELKAGPDEDAGTPIGQGQQQRPDPMERQQARSEVRQIQAQPPTQGRRPQGDVNRANAAQVEAAARADMEHARHAERLTGPAKDDPWTATAGDIDWDTFTPDAAGGIAWESVLVSTLDALRPLWAKAAQEQLMGDPIASQIPPEWVAAIKAPKQFTLGQWLAAVKKHLEGDSTSIKDLAALAAA